MEWSPPARSFGCRRWAQESLKWEYGNHQERHQCCPGPENQLLQRHCCHFTPDKTSFCLHRLGKLNLVSVCKTPRWSAAFICSTKCRGSSGEGQAQPHILLTWSLFFRLWSFLQSSPICFFCFCLTGGGCLSVARACIQWGSAKSPCLQPLKCARALVCSWDSFHELATKHWPAPTKLLFVLWGAEVSCITWLLTEEDHPAFHLPQRHSLYLLQEYQEGSREVWHWKQTEKHGLRFCMTGDESREMAMVHLQGWQEGRSLQPSLLQKSSSKGYSGANVALQTLWYRVEMQSPDLGTYCTILCRGKVRCLRFAIQAQPYTVCRAKFGRWTFILTMKVSASFAFEHFHPFFWL